MRIFYLSVVLCSLLQASSFQSATGWASARVVIVPSAKTEQVRSLQFDGSSEYPSTVSAYDDSAAVLVVTGIDEYVYRVQLPDNVYMRSDNQMAWSSKVRVHSFTTSGAREATCPNTLQIGATRDPFPYIPSINYKGAFMVTIIY